MGLKQCIIMMFLLCMFDFSKLYIEEQTSTCMRLHVFYHKKGLVISILVCFMMQTKVEITRPFLYFEVFVLKFEFISIM